MPGPISPAIILHRFRAAGQISLGILKSRNVWLCIEVVAIMIAAIGSFRVVRPRARRRDYKRDQPYQFIVQQVKQGQSTSPSIFSRFPFNKKRNFLHALSYCAPYRVAAVECSVRDPSDSHCLVTAQYGSPTIPNPLSTCVYGS
jgi:hypothetical protein